MAGENDIRQGLVTYLTSLPDLVSALGGAGKISPVRSRMGVPMPRVCYQVLDDVPIRSAGGPCGTSQARIQVDVISRNYDQAVALSWLIVGRKSDPRIDGFKGNWGDIEIDECRLEARADEADDPGDGSDNWVYHERLDLLVTYGEV